MGREENVFLFVPNLIGYLRLVLAAASFWLMPRAPHPAALCYGLSTALDAVDGHLARKLGQESLLGSLLDMLTDRLCSLCLLLNLALLYPHWALPIQLCIATDLASHWLHLHCSALAGRSHKAVGGEGPLLLRIYYSNKPLLFTLCLGQELFHCCLYLVYWGEGPTVIPGAPGLFRVGLWAGAPLALLKFGVNFLQLGSAAQSLAAIDRAERQKRA